MVLAVQVLDLERSNRRNIDVTLNEYTQILASKTAIVAEESKNNRRQTRVSVPTTDLIVGKERRARLIECLREFDEAVTLPDLAEEIAVREFDAEITELSGERIKEIYLTLYHTDVPKLAEADILEYDQERDLVSSGPKLSALEEDQP